MLIEATTQTTLGNVYILNGNDDLHVGAGIQIECTYGDLATHTGADAIIAWSGTHSITVDGTIIGKDECINLIGCETAQTVSIHAGAVLRAGGDGVVTDADGVILDGVNSTLSNAGTITAYGSGLSLFVHDGGTTTIFNSGTISGRVAGVWNKFGAGVLEFTNTGTVESPDKAYWGGNFIDHVTNSGLMTGLVDLGNGNDRYDGRSGRVVGDILGGDGDDTFLLGKAVDHIIGGAGFDTLDYAVATVAVTVNLGNNALNAGLARYDTYSGIERVIGGTRADHLTGDAQDNTLIGNAGADTLYGADGNDVLSGGAAVDWLYGGNGNDMLTGGVGIDRLYGGAGADSFVFGGRADQADYVQDFAHGLDHIVLEGSSFGYGSYAGAISAADFVISNRAVALDASDRFIFRTTDQTLWYDADGRGGVAAFMIADLQSGAVMSAADILIV